MMKKVLSLAFASLMVMSLAACGSSGGTTSTPAESTPAPAESTPAASAPAESAPAASTPSGEATGVKINAPDDVSIGVCIYKFDDTFMTGVRNNMLLAAEELGIPAPEIVDSQNKQATQNDQVDTYITKGVTALAVNPVDLTAAGPIIDKAMAEDLPIVFLNRQPSEEDMNKYDKAWYVGARAEESGTMSGEIILDYFKAHPEADKNGDGKIQYVMLQGEPGHQDATLRSQYCIEAITNDGTFGVEELAADTAMWDKVKATDLMKTFLASHGADKIEAVFANNDDMALGAIEALKAEGYNTGDAEKFIPVVGVDATAPALESMSKGELLGTMSGEIILDYFKAHPEADKNGDGKIQYVMLQGEPGHQDATLRSQYCIEAITNDGTFGVEELAADTAMWDKVKATDLMKTFLASHGADKIEAVFANNDDMALGAIEALKAEGYNTGDAEKFIPVVGVDATAPALESMSKGELLGTVLNDGENQGKASINIAAVAADGQEVTSETIGYEVTDGKYVWIPYVKVTVDNYQDFM